MAKSKKKKKQKKVNGNTKNINQKSVVPGLIKYIAAILFMIAATVLMPGKISSQGIDLFRLVFSWLVVFFLPGFLLLPLIDKQIKPDWLEAIPLTFAASLAFLTAPLLAGYFLHLGFLFTTYTALTAIMLLAAVMFILETRKIIEPLKIDFSFDWAKTVTASLAVISASIVLKLGAEMPTIGDNKVHLARIRRILEAPSLSPQAIEPFKDGGIHPGYAYPVWHLIQALVSKVSGIDPILLWYYLNPLLTLVMVLTIYFLIRALFHNRSLAAFTSFLYMLPLIFAPGKGTLMTQRLLVHPSELSFLFFHFIIFGLVVIFIRNRGFHLPLFVLIGALSIDLAFIHIANLTFVVVVYVVFMAIIFLTQLERRDRLIKAAALLSIFVIAGFLYYFNVSQTAMEISGKSADDIKYYLEQDRLYQFENGGVLPHPKNLLPLLLPFLIAGVFAPIVKKRLGLSLLFSNLIAIIFIGAVPAVFMSFAKTITYTHAVRFQGHTSLEWLLTSVLLFAGLSFISKKSEALISKNMEPFDVAKAALIVIIPIAAYFIGWPKVTNFFNALSNELALVLSIIIALTVLFLILISLRFKLISNTDSLEEVLIKPPHTVVMAAFFIFYAIFSIPSWTDLRTNLTAAPPLPTDPIMIQGNQFMISHPLIDTIRKSVPEDAVILSDHQTSEVLTAFVPRYVATYPGGHQSSTQVGGDQDEHMIKVVSFFRPDWSAEQRKEIIVENDVDYVLINRANLQRFQLQTKDYVDNLRMIFDDGNFALYEVEKG